MFEKNTVVDARAVDSSIRMPDVKKWFEQTVKTKKQVHGQNSYVANGPYNEYHLDLFYQSSSESITHSCFNLHRCIQ